MGKLILAMVRVYLWRDHYGREYWSESTFEFREKRLAEQFKREVESRKDFFCQLIFEE